MAGSPGDRCEQWGEAGCWRLRIATSPRTVDDGFDGTAGANIMPRRKCVTKFWCGVLFAVLLVGCSSTHTARRGSSSTTVASATHAASTEPKDAAIALASRMLDKAVLPAGARPSTAPPPAVVRGPSVPGIGNLVFAHRLFTVNEAPHAVWQWLQAHVPKGFVGVGGSSGTDRGVPSWGCLLYTSPSPRDS